MIQLGTLVKVSDKSGIILGKCIKVLGFSNKRIANIGDIILIVVKRIDNKHFKNMKLFKKKRFFKGTIHRALVIRSKVNFLRVCNVYIKFNENAVILVNKKIVPISNRVYGPVLRELCMRWPSLGCVSRFII